MSYLEFKKRFFEEDKNKQQAEPVEYLCEKLHDATHNNVYTDDVDAQEADRFYYLKKMFFSGAGLFSMLLLVIVLCKERFFRQLELKVH